MQKKMATAQKTGRQNTLATVIVTQIKAKITEKNKLWTTKLDAIKPNDNVHCKIAKRLRNNAFEIPTLKQNGTYCIYYYEDKEKANILAENFRKAHQNRSTMTDEKENIEQQIMTKLQTIHTWKESVKL